MKVFRSRVGPRGRVTIPKEIREHLGIDVGDWVSFTISPEGDVRMDSAQQVVARIRTAVPGDWDEREQENG